MTSYGGLRLAAVLVAVMLAVAVSCIADPDIVVRDRDGPMVTTVAADRVAAVAATLDALLLQKAALQEQLVTCTKDCDQLRADYVRARLRFNRAVNVRLGIRRPSRVERHWRAWCPVV